MNWAKHAAEAIVDDERELQAAEDRRRRNRLILTLGALAGTAGLGAGVYAKRDAIGKMINEAVGTPKEPVDWGGLATRGGAATVAALAPLKSVLGRLPFGGGVRGLQSDISNVQHAVDPKTLTPEAQAIARTHKTSPELVNNLNKALDDKKLVNEILETHRTAANAVPGAKQIPGPIDSLSLGQKLKATLGGLVTGKGITQGQRDVSRLPEAFAHLGKDYVTSPNLRDVVARKLGLPVTGSGPEGVAATNAQLKGFGDVAQMLKARRAAPGRFQLPTKGTLGRAAVGAFAPEILSGLGSAYHMVRGE